MLVLPLHCWCREKSTFRNAVFEVSLHSGQVLETACQRTIRPGNIMRVLYLVPLRCNFFFFFFFVIVSFTFFFFSRFLKCIVGRVMECECDEFQFNFKCLQWTSLTNVFILEVEMFVTFSLPSNSSRAITSTKNAFTVELLIGFAWDC